MFSSNSSAPQPWQQEEASDRGRFPPIESAAYQPSLDQQPHYHPPRGEQPPDNFTSREDTRREDNRYSSREHGYTRYPSREEEHREQSSPLHSQRSSPPHLGESQGLPLQPEPCRESCPQGPGMLNPDPYSRLPQHMSFTQPAPRQRTAIACRYCRRRKIRCSGFESSPDGRCSNCQRFNQECIFTPVSSQTQAFVPAHTQYPQMRQVPGVRSGSRSDYSTVSVPVYGAHGQLLSIQDYPVHGSPSHPLKGRASSPGPHQNPQGPTYETNYEQAPFSEPRDRPASEIHPVLPLLPRRSSQGDYPSWARPDQPNSPPILPPPRGFSPPSGHTSNTAYGYAESAPSSFYQSRPSGSVRRSPPPYQVDRPASISPHQSIHPPMWPGPQRPESTGPPIATQAPSLRLGFSNVSEPPGMQRSAHDHEMLNQLKKIL